ncbi:MAG: hypothetical protein ACLVG5_00750 [Clostridium sp.]
MGRNAEDICSEENTPFEMMATVLSEGTDVLLVACGEMAARRSMQLLC